MATQMLFYSSAVPISKSGHGELYVKTGLDYSFASTVNSVPLTAAEFPRASAEYSVVFTGEGDAIMPVVILGVGTGSNLYVDDEGQWTGRYIPAFIRRYPFVFSSNEDASSFTLCIDESFSGCNTEGRGERLFDADGERTQYLESMLNFVQEYQAHFRRTREFCARLNELGLLEPMHAQYRLGSDEWRSLTGFMAVNRAKLKTLDDEELAGMVRRDELELLYLHLHSLNNFGPMLERAGGAAAGATEAPVASEQD